MKVNGSRCTKKLSIFRTPGRSSHITRRIVWVPAAPGDSEVCAGGETLVHPYCGGGESERACDKDRPS